MNTQGFVRRVPFLIRTVKVHQLALAAVVVLIAGIRPVIAADLSQTVKFSIAPQGLPAALLKYSEQSGVQVTSSSDLIDGKSTGGVEGSLPARAALELILLGTELGYDIINGNTVAIVRAASSRAASPPEVSAQASESSKMELEEVIVTAQKREERLIDTPQSVTVLSSDALAKLGATQLRDFANTVPGLSFQTGGAGFNQVTLRGVTAGYDSSPTVGIYVDDVPYGSSSGFARGGQLALDVGLFDVDRIEVLRGPQGTLYGASTMGGLLKYVSKLPDPTAFGMDARTGISGTHDGGISYDGALAINTPIVTDAAALRVSGFYSRDGGYIDNLALGEKDANRSDIYGGRADVLFTPTDALTIRIGGVLQNISREGTATADYTLAGAPLYGELNQRRLIAEPFDQHFRLGSGTLGYDFGPATLTSISSYQTTQARFSVDASPLFVPALASLGPFSAVGVLNDVTTKKLTQEVRLASDESGQFEWLIGGFYTRETSVNGQEFLLRSSAGSFVPNNLYIYSRPSRYEEYAAFGDLTYRLTSKFDLSGGVRYAHNDQVSTQFGSGLLVASRPTRSVSDHVATYLANARYHFGDHATGYLRYATGYRPGGPNAVGNDPVTGRPLGLAAFEPDRLKSYEAGFKAETADRAFGVDLAGYYVDWDNIQVLTTSNGFSVTANAPGGATVRGAELTLTARPTGDFTATGAFAYQDAQLSEATPALQASKGERLPNVPRFTAAMSADYEFAGSALQPTIGATLRYLSDRRASFDANRSVVQYQLPDYTIADIRAGFVLGSVSLQLYVHNLFDKRGQQIAPTGISSLSGPVFVSILQPLTIGINATTHF